MKTKCNQILAKSALLFCILSILLVSRPVSSYDLAYHKDISARVLNTSSFTPDAIEFVGNANVYVDLAVNTTARNDPFLRKIHFDDRFRFSQHKALRDELLGKIPNLNRLNCNSSRDDIYVFGAAMGLIHHAIQDYYAHSNHVELLELYQGSPTTDKTFDDVMRPDPGLETLKDTWIVDIESDVFEALVSGAYFVQPPPELDDSVGDPTHLTHDILNKDQYRGGTPYLYPDMNRQSIHFKSTWTAKDDLVDLMPLFYQANPVCYSALSTLTLSLIEYLSNRVSSGLANFSGTITGHWRSGNPVVIGDGLSVTILAPTHYPDWPILQRDNYTYQVTNTGSRDIARISLAARGSVLVDQPIASPSGWRSTFVDGEVTWTADSGSELSPSDTLELTIDPSDGSTFGYVDMYTESGRFVTVLGPVKADLMMGHVITALAVLDERDVDSTLDAFHIPDEARSLQRLLTPSIAENLVPLLIGLLVLLLLLIFWLLWRR